MIFGLPTVSVILLVAAFIITVIVLFSAVVDSSFPIFPSSVEYLRLQMARKNHTRAVQTFWLIVAVLFCLAAVIAAI